MELRQLRYFVSVARELNFTKAASRLRVAQPALSRQVRQLEDELGVALLKRGSRGVQLTEAGALFLDEAAALIAQSENAVHRIRSDDHARQGRINVGYVWGLFHTLVPQWMARFRRQNPGVAVNLLDLTAIQQAEALEQRKLDLGFIGFSFEADSARLSKRRIGKCALMAALPEQHPAAGRRKVTLNHLSNEFFIVISDQTYPGAAHLLKTACAKAGFRPRILQTAERGYTILGMVAASCGVTLLPESLKAVPHPGVVFRPLEDPPEGDLYVAWNPGAESPGVRTFVSMVSSEPLENSV